MTTSKSADFDRMTRRSSIQDYAKSQRGRRNIDNRAALTPTGSGIKQDLAAILRERGRSKPPTNISTDIATAVAGGAKGSIHTGFGLMLPLYERMEAARAAQAAAASAPVATTYGPPPSYAPPPSTGGGGDDILAAQLAALGGGPDRSSYLRPFDEAVARSRQAYSSAVPEINASYGQLRANLATGQADFASQQAATAAQQAARIQQGTAQTAALQAPVLNDLRNQFGNDALGSLTGAVGAEASQQVANAQQQAARQSALTAELASGQQRSYEARLADADVANSASTANARVNLNSILAQLGVGRAGAERQYAGDLNDHQQQVAQLRIGAMRERAAASDPSAALDWQLKQLRLQQGLADFNAPEDPLLALERQVKERQLRSALTPAGLNPAWVKKAPMYKTRQPTAYAYLQQLTDVNSTAKDAMAGLQSDLAHWAEDKRGKGQYILFQNKRIDPAVVRSWIKTYYGAS